MLGHDFLCIFPARDLLNFLICKLMSFSKFENLYLFYLQIFVLSHSFISTATPITHMLDRLLLSHKPLSFSNFLFFFNVSYCILQVNIFYGSIFIVTNSFLCHLYSAINSLQLIFYFRCCFSVLEFALLMWFLFLLRDFFISSIFSFTSLNIVIRAA